MEGDIHSENNFTEVCDFFKMQLPECSCDAESVFKEVFKPEVWKTVLNSEHGNRLKKLLPSFPENDEKEKDETLKKLIDGENFKFGNPLRQFFNKLHTGLLSPSVMKLMEALKKANFREYKDQQRDYASNLLRDILISRKKLLEAASNSPPDDIPKMQQFVFKPKKAVLLERTRLRYFSILQEIREAFSEPGTSSEDENYPEKMAPQKFRKCNRRKRKASELPAVCSTTSCLFGYPDSSNVFNTWLEKYEVTNQRYREMLRNHKKRIATGCNHPKLKFSDIELKDVIARANEVGKMPSDRKAPHLVRKKSKFPGNTDKDTNLISIIPSENTKNDKSSFATVSTRNAKIDACSTSTVHPENIKVIALIIHPENINVDANLILTVPAQNADKNINSTLNAHTENANKDINSTLIIQVENTNKDINSTWTLQTKNVKKDLNLNLPVQTGNINKDTNSVLAENINKDTNSILTQNADKNINSTLNAHTENANKDTNSTLIIQVENTNKDINSTWTFQTKNAKKGLNLTLPVQTGNINKDTNSVLAGNINKCTNSILAENINKDTNSVLAENINKGTNSILAENINKDTNSVLAENINKDTNFILAENINKDTNSTLTIHAENTNKDSSLTFIENKVSSTSLNKVNRQKPFSN